MEQDVKLQFMQVALKLFAEKGYFNTSIDEIVEETGFSKGLLFYHFRSKENLLTEVLTYEKMKSQEMFNEDFSLLNGKELLLILMERYFDSLIDQRNFWVLYIQILLNKELRSKLNGLLDELHTIYFEKVESMLLSRNDVNLSNKVYNLDIMKNGVLLKYLIENDTTQLTLMKHGLLRVLE